MCNCVIKCVGFRRSRQFIVIWLVKRFASDSRAKSPLPSHKKAPAPDSSTSFRTATTPRHVLVCPFFLGFDSECIYGLPTRRNSHQLRLKPKFEPACRLI